MEMPPFPKTRIALAGLYGYGTVHLRALQPLIAAGTCELVAVVDRRAPDETISGLTGAARFFDDFTSMLAATRPDIVILATPIPTHAPLATEAMRAGAHVLIEKPPTATLASFTELVEVSERTGRACQIGFQSFGSLALDRIDEVLAAGEIGDLVGIGGVGTWLRHPSYYARAAWAGKRVLDGVEVVDGVVTNPLAHAVATALRIDHSTRAGDVVGLEVDLYRANDIEADDTSAVRIITARGTRIGLGLTVSARTQTAPRLIVEGTTGSMTFFYTEDRLIIVGADGERTETFGRTSLTENLIAHTRDSSIPLLSGVADSGSFMRVLEAVRTAPDPMPIAPEHVQWRENEGGPHLVLTDVEAWCELVATTRRTFTTLGAPWARQSARLAELTVAGQTVATYVDGAGMSPLDSPRPHLHPVRTRAGVLVSDAAPADHTWHAGVGVAVQDVNGSNLWGGRTCRPDSGYQWRGDHGRILHRGWLTDAGALTPQATPIPPAIAGPATDVVGALDWTGPDQEVLATEVRRMSTRALGETAWALDVEFAVTNPGPAPLSLGSPGSNGSAGSGYGGFFWRLPAGTDVDVRTPHHRGEAAVHGTVADWLAWSAEGAEGPFTLVFTEVGGGRDPWFVRAAGYPGVGSALAWEDPVAIAPGATTARHLRVIVADGRLSDEQVTELLDHLPRRP